MLLEGHVWRDHHPNPLTTLAIALFGEMQHAFKYNLGADNARFINTEPHSHV